MTDLINHCRRCRWYWLAQCSFWRWYVRADMADKISTKVNKGD